MRIKLLWIAVIIGLSSCDSKDSNVVPVSTFSFKVDTIAFHSNATEAFITDTLYPGKKTLIVDGVSNNFEHHMELMITFPDSIHTGSYENLVEMSLMSIEQKAEGYVSKRIQVNITGINSKHAEGTFSGVLINGDIEKQLTDGTFKVEIY